MYLFNYCKTSKNSRPLLIAALTMFHMYNNRRYILGGGMQSLDSELNDEFVNETLISML